MPAAQYCVCVVLDREYGARISELVPTGPVWIVDTPINRAAAQKLWIEHPGQSHLGGVTTFKSTEGCSPEDSLISELGTIDLHHGTYSAEPPYTVLQIVGVAATERIKAALSMYGFNEFYATSVGFRAVRPVPTPHQSDTER